MDQGTLPTFADAYKLVLKDILANGEWAPPVTDPRSPASGFGTRPRASRELLGYSFTLADPRSSLFLAPHIKPVRVPYYFGLLLWTLAGSDEADWLSFYHPHAKQYADDGVHLCGAFGHRLMKSRGDQFSALAAQLVRDPGTRRAFAAILFPEDVCEVRMDYPCAIGLHYFLRAGALHAITFMRAQQALTLLPFDLFIFCCIQLWLASRLQVAVGTYRHMCGTIHIYEDELPHARSLLSQTIQPLSVGEYAGFSTDLPILLDMERRVREAALRSEIATLQSVADSLPDSSSLTTVASAGILLNACDYARATALQGEVMASLTGRYPEWFGWYYSRCEK